MVNPFMGFILELKHQRKNTLGIYCSHGCKIIHYTHISDGFTKFGMK